MPSPPKPSPLSSSLAWLLISAAAVWSLRSFLFEGNIPAFRDGFHFYWPQLVWLDQSYQAGDYFPNWNPNEGLGSSVCAQPTWQIYYPPRILFLLPALSLAQRLGLFVLLHVLIGVWGMIQATRALNLSPSAAWLSTVAFTFSCPVLFQVNNLVYLCSAAWVACSLSAIVWLLNFGQPKAMLHSICLVVTCGSMMTVCGDPHGAVNLALIAVAATLGGLYRRRRGPILNDSQTRPSNCRTPLAVYLCTVLAISLAGIQTHQSLQWLRISSRSPSWTPIVDSFHPMIQQILTETTRDPSAARSRNTFDFSLSPWNLSTLIWPTFNGHFQPDNSRWVQAIPSESRMWTVSMYVGLIPIVLATWGIFRSRSSTQNWLLLFCCLSLLLAMGNYSIGWLLHNLVDTNSGTRWASWPVTDGQLSLYGLLVQFLPGYDSFRYPAKWIVWFIGFVALLAGINADRLLTEDSRSTALDRPRDAAFEKNPNPMISIISFGNRLLLIAIISLVVLMAVSMGYSINQVRSQISAWLESSYDRLAGHADLRSSFKTILRSLVQTMVVCLSVYVSVYVLASRKLIRGAESPEQAISKQRAWNAKLVSWRSTRALRIGWILVLITVIDLCSLHSSWLCSTAPLALEPVKIQSQRVNKASETDASIGRAANLVWADTTEADLDRFQLDRFQPDSDFLDRLQPDSDFVMANTLQLQVTFLLSKLCHTRSVAALHASGSIEPQSIVTIRRWLQQNDTLQPEQAKLDAVLSELGVTARLAKNPQGQLYWRAVTKPRALVELFTKDMQPITSSSASFAWLDNQTLQIEFTVDEDAIVLIRQFNDGQWKLESSDRQETATSPPRLLPIQSKELFVTAQVNSGFHRLLLRR